MVKTIGNLGEVVIKGFMGRPTRLKYVNNSGKSVCVLCRDGKTLMSFAIDVVYQYDSEGFIRLCEAFENKDIELLEKEWQRAIPYKPESAG